MKKILICAIIACGAVTAVAAQDSPVSFGIKGGVNLSNFGGDALELKDGSLKYDDKNALVGFQAGITIDYQLASSLYLLTGLEFTTKGAKYESSLAGISTELKQTPMYLQIPVHIGFKLGITDATKLVFHAGPYAAYGIGGKTKVTGDLAGWTGETETDFFGDDTFKKFDWGLGLGVGLELGKLTFNVGYDLGLADIAQNEIKIGGVTVSNNDAKVRTQTAYATVGIKF